MLQATTGNNCACGFAYALLSDPRSALVSVLDCSVCNGQYPVFQVDCVFIYSGIEDIIWWQCNHRPLTPVDFCPSHSVPVQWRHIRASIVSDICLWLCCYSETRKSIVILELTPYLIKKLSIAVSGNLFMKLCIYNVISADTALPVETTALPRTSDMGHLKRHLDWLVQ